MLWLPLAAGFGLWLSANLVYLRAMVSIHIFVKTPLNAPLMIAAGLCPWLAVCATGSYVGTVAVCVLGLLYVVLLLWQLWPIRRDLTDALPHAVFCVLGGCVASAGQIHHALGPAAAAAGETGGVGGGGDSAAAELALAAGCGLVACGHWGLTCGRLLYR